MKLSCFIYTLLASIATSAADLAPKYHEPTFLGFCGSFPLELRVKIATDVIADLKPLTLLAHYFEEGQVKNKLLHGYENVEPINSYYKIFYHTTGHYAYGHNHHSLLYRAQPRMLYAMFSVNTSMRKWLLSKAGEDFVDKMNQQQTNKTGSKEYFDGACRAGYLVMARLIYACGVKKKDLKSEALCGALGHNHEDTIRWFLSLQIDVNLCTPDRLIPIHEASKANNLLFVQLLVDNDAHINIEANDRTSLTIACQQGFKDIAEYLLAKGASPEKGRMSPVYEATQYKHYEVIRLLHRYKAEPRPYLDGWTPMYRAILNDDPECVTLLCDLYPELIHKKIRNETPLDSARRLERFACEQILLKHFITTPERLH